MNYNGTRDDLDFLNPNEIESEEIEKTKHDLFHECEDMPDEAINYVDELETQIRKAKEELKFICEAMQVKGQLTFYINKITNILNILK